MTLMEKKIFKKKKKIYCGRGENPITNCEEGPALGSRGGPGSGAGATYPLGDSPWTHLNCKLLPSPAPSPELWACSRVGGHGW